MERYYVKYDFKTKKKNCYKTILISIIITDKIQEAIYALTVEDEFCRRTAKLINECHCIDHAVEDEGKREDKYFNGVRYWRGKKVYPPQED